ncbi:GNAT family N-acetyltransferase [Kribbella solani]|uniref:GNAT family N-acetyltransferase n=1 Tax=Kribbella solani TaxID=236067 RepID=UPI0029A6A71A|nr:GNAT family N-acetyltransferase [Kribbella solani]MDX2968619.1 GNAT family N-acetyltransferase [Kribbella solani]MDX3006621.1 GNAT family N-acetyltransferase [Kribbella solani]
MRTLRLLRGTRHGTSSLRRRALEHPLIVGQATFDEPEIADELARRAHGHGYATEAARAMVDAAAGTGRRRLWATVREWNAPSFRALEKVGFERSARVTEDRERGNSIWLTRALP